MYVIPSNVRRRRTTLSETFWNKLGGGGVSPQTPWTRHCILQGQRTSRASLPQLRPGLCRDFDDISRLLIQVLPNILYAGTFSKGAQINYRLNEI